MARSRCGVHSPGTRWICEASQAMGPAAGRARFQKVEHVLLLAAADGEHPVRRDLGGRLAVVGVHLELAFGVRSPSMARLVTTALGHHHGAKLLAEVGVLVDHFGDDVARALQGIFTLATPFSESTKEAANSRRGVSDDAWSQRYSASGSSPFSRAIDGLGAALGLVGQVEVFEVAFVERRFDARLQLVGELALFLDGIQDRLRGARRVRGKYASCSSMERIWTSSRLPVASLR